MKTLDHPNIVKLKHYFYQSQEKKKEDGCVSRLARVLCLVPAHPPHL